MGYRIFSNCFTVEVNVYVIMSNFTSSHRVPFKVVRADLFQAFDEPEGG